MLKIELSDSEAILLERFVCSSFFLHPEFFNVAGFMRERTDVLFGFYERLRDSLYSVPDKTSTQ